VRRYFVTAALALMVPCAADARDETKARPRRVYYPWPGNGLVRPPIVHGNNPRVRVLLPSRLDWTYAASAAALGTAPPEARPHDATQTVYQLWVPRSYKHAAPHPLVLFISPKQFPDEWGSWIDVCSKHGVMFAAVPGGGSNAHPALRLRVALDVLDDLRRRMAIDTDRVYVGGYAEGARTACELAFAYPEFVGGVVAIGGASSPRQEPWMRERMKERLSVAYVTGGLDPARREIEVFRHPVTRDLGARTRLWSVPMAANAMPASAVLEDAYLWLEAGLAGRRALMAASPTSKMAVGVVPPAEAWAQGVLEEAKARLKDRGRREAGLMLLAGLAERWAGGETARKAAKLLEAHDERGKGKWQDVYNRQQVRFAFLEAKAFADYVEGPLPVRDLARKPALLQELAGLWELVEKYGPDTDEGREAGRRLEELRKQLPAR
jgi:pimeloyl-ACP methyl ester carboxylesterase